MFGRAGLRVCPNARSASPAAPIAARHPAKRAIHANHAGRFPARGRRLGTNVVGRFGVLAMDHLNLRVLRFCALLYPPQTAVHCQRATVVVSTTSRLPGITLVRAGAAGEPDEASLWNAFRARWIARRRPLAAGWMSAGVGPRRHAGDNVPCLGRAQPSADSCPSAMSARLAVARS